MEEKLQSLRPARQLEKITSVSLAAREGNRNHTYEEGEWVGGGGL